MKHKHKHCHVKVTPVSYNEYFNIGDRVLLDIEHKCHDHIHHKPVLVVTPPVPGAHPGPISGHPCDDVCCDEHIHKPLHPEHPCDKPGLHPTPPHCDEHMHDHLHHPEFPCDDFWEDEYKHPHHHDHCHNDIWTNGDNVIRPITPPTEKYPPEVPLPTVNREWLANNGF